MKINYISILGMIALSSCSNNFDQITEIYDGSDIKELKINVTAGDSYVEGEKASRISDNGAVSIFEKDDRVGLIVLENGQPIEKNNIPFIYDGKDWSFDLQTAEEEGKSIYYYNSAKTNLKYIMYYPYSSNADEITNIQGLKEEFQPEIDQSSEEKFRASDLLVWELESPNALETIKANMTHAYPSFSLNVVIGGTLDDGASTPYTAGEVSNVRFTVGENIIIPYKAEDGTYRYILEENYNGEIGWSYTNDGKNYSNKRNISSATANTRYVQKEAFTSTGNYTFDKAQVGDYYCLTNDNKGYLVPYNANVDVLNDKKCLGIVFRIKKDGEDGVPYNSNFNYHGTVVALTDASSAMIWTTGEPESINNWISSWSEGKPENYNSIMDKTKPQGWANTLAIRAYNNTIVSDDMKVQQITKLDEFALVNPLPESTTGWYWPSIFELRTIVCGQGAEEMNKDVVGHNRGKQFLDKQYDRVKAVLKLNGELFLTGDYWASTESSVDGKNAYSFDIKGQTGAWFNQSGNPKKTSNYLLKLVFAF